MTQFISFASSSSGNCGLYDAGARKILIDAGTNTKYIKNSLAQIGLCLGDITDILITHTHRDHISALPVLTKQCKARILCSEGSYGALLPECNHENIETFQTGVPFCLEDLQITAFDTPHDCKGSCGFVFENGNGKFTYCTDLGKITPEIYEKLKGSHTVFLESNHDVYMLKNGEYPYYLKQRILSDQGHISNDTAAHTVTLLAEEGLQRAILAHLSEHNNTVRCALRETEEALKQIGAAGRVIVTAAPHKQTASPVLL
ncbi:MBL fold metallo-hydrolase [Acidaminobacterium chupaoyuni]